MHVIQAANIRDALPKAMKYLLNYGRVENTRNGKAYVAPGPVTIKYHVPKQHVLLNHVRDANPFFHLMESMWMLAGRNDGAFLDYYIKDFSKLYGVEGIIPDAYGYRWRHGLVWDQLDEVVQQLRKDHTSRQIVLQMWGAGADDLIAPAAKPCNLAATFRVNGDKLDMTVFNRSNDLLWGCCGANAVHFPILQEYVATLSKLKIGCYWQVSTNLHFYVEHCEMLKKRIGDIGNKGLYSFLWNEQGYEETQPLVSEPDSFDKDLFDTMFCIECINRDDEDYDGNIANSFLRNTVLPMARAHHYYKNKDMEIALEEIECVKAEDWRRAGKEWLERHNGSG